MPLSASEEDRNTKRSNAEAESRLYTSDYVEARGVLLPAIEYLKHAVEAARTQDGTTGELLATVSRGTYLLPSINADT